MIRKSGRKHGEVFTNSNVVQYILDEVGYCASDDLSFIKILEPSSGKGAFATEIISRLFQSSIKHKFSFSEAVSNNVHLFEMDAIAFAGLKEAIDQLIERLTKKPSQISSKICFQEDFLEFDFKKKFHCIVGNPPYIRHELLSEEKKKIYRTTFTTFKYRADLYILFFEKSLNLLEKRGLLSFICSNRWLNNQYGEGLRSLISTKFNLVKLLNIEKASPFDEDVIAYPCISTVSNRKQSETTLYYEDNSKTIDFGSLHFNKIKMPTNSAWQNLFLKYDINHQNLLGIIEQGFEIGIGVATGADKIFIRSKSEINEIEKSRLIPLIKGHDLRNNKMSWGEHFVINPYENDTLCDLDKYPRLKTYLLEHKSLLMQRHTAQKAPEKWYKTIDKIKPDIQHKPKLLLPDLTGNKLLFIDDGNYYPHHSIYYITCKDLNCLKILAAILMSDFIKKQMSQIGIRMNGGLPRFQSQILKKIKIPNISLFEQDVKSLLIESYEVKNFNLLNCIINDYCNQYKIIRSEEKSVYFKKTSIAPIEKAFTTC